MNENIPESPDEHSDLEDENFIEREQLKRQCTSQKTYTIKSILKTSYSPTGSSNKRRFLSVIDGNTKLLTPENKNSIENQPTSDFTKLSRFTSFKANKLASLKRVKVSLFHEKFQKSEPKENSFSLDTKLFYGASINKASHINVYPKREESTKPIIKKQFKTKKTPLLHKISQKHWLKKHKRGEINCGVGHGVKKSNAKRRLFKDDLFGCEKQNSNLNVEEFHSSTSNFNKTDENSKVQGNNVNNIKTLNLETYNSTKKFFKYKSSTILESTTKKNHFTNFNFVNRGLYDINSIYKPINVKNQDVNVNNTIFEYNSYKILKGNRILCDSKTPQKMKSHIEDVKTNCTSSTELKDTVYNTTRDLLLKKLDHVDQSAEENVNHPKINTEIKEIESINSDLSCATGCSKIITSKISKNDWGIPTICNRCQNNKLNLNHQTVTIIDENEGLNSNINFQALKSQEWKNQQLLFEDPVIKSRIIVVQPSNSIEQQKLMKLLAVIAEELSIRDTDFFDLRNKKIYLYVKQELILAVLITEHISTAFRIIPESFYLNYYIAEGGPVKCGINVIWTLKSHRRQGIASRLIDILRENYCCNYVLSIDDIAFTFLTPLAKVFAEKYTKSRNCNVV